jgi:hypothetical protein
VRFTLREGVPRYPLNRMLGGSQSQSGRYGKMKILVPTGTRAPTAQSSSPVPSSYTDCAAAALTCAGETKLLGTF